MKTKTENKRGLSIFGRKYPHIPAWLRNFRAKEAGGVVPKK